MLHQVPPGSITSSSLPSALPTPLFPFSSVTQYLIPTQQFCDRLLTFCANHHRVIGYPVCIREGKYSRNEFIFNFAIVIGENELDWACYGEVVRKLGRLLRGLEEQGGFLSREEEGIWEDEGSAGAGGGVEGLGGGSKVYALCEMVLEDLNNYAECMIPIGNLSPRRSMRQSATGHTNARQMTPTRSISSCSRPGRLLHPSLRIKSLCSL